MGGRRGPTIEKFNYHYWLEGFKTYRGLIRFFDPWLFAGRGTHGQKAENGYRPNFLQILTQSTHLLLFQNISFEESLILSDNPELFDYLDFLIQIYRKNLKFLRINPNNGYSKDFRRYDRHPDACRVHHCPNRNPAKQSRLPIGYPLHQS